MKPSDLSLTQRYFHFVALDFEARKLPDGFFRAARLSKKGDPITLPTGQTFQHLHVSSDHRYDRGNFDRVSDETPGPPFLYDAVLVESRDKDIVCLGFPFRKLAVRVVNILVEDFNILSFSKFIKVDMQVLIDLFDAHTDFVEEESKNHYFLAGVDLSLSGETYLSSVRLAGDKPLDSKLYKEYFKNRVKRKLSRLERCILKGEISYPEGATRPAVSSLHVDKFGNYKLYVQSQARNLPTIGVIFDFLHKQKALVPTLNNPVWHILEDQSNEL